MTLPFLGPSWLALSLAAATLSQAQSPPSCLDRARGLKLDSLPGPVPTYYSATFRDRAARDQALLRDAERFFADSLGLPPGLHLALLNEADWRRIGAAAQWNLPYGLPHVCDRVAFLPATDDGVITMDMLRRESTLSDTVRAKIAREGTSFGDFARSMTGFIGLHELGHTYVEFYGIAAHARWFNEFLASYFAYVFFETTNPRQARLANAMVEAKLEQPPPEHTSLEDFQQLYGDPPALSPDNINWYQARFLERVAAVSSSQGLAFLRSVRAAFPRAEPDSVSLRSVLDRLERIQPGFRAWAGQRR